MGIPKAQWLTSSSLPAFRSAGHVTPRIFMLSLGHAIHAAGGSGIVYPSVRFPKGQCAALFFPDLGSNARQTRHLDYHWNGTDIDYYRVAGTKEVFAIRK
jgi:hypothetical protein